MVKIFSKAELEAQLPEIQAAPKLRGSLDLIVIRPAVDQRKVLKSAELCLERGLIGDSWITRSSRHTSDKSPWIEMQLNIMSSRVIQAVTGDLKRWPLAGDQLFIDLDLSLENLPIGSQISIGETIIEVTAPPHTACKKFRVRYGDDAFRFINNPATKNMRLRGLNAKIIRGGTIESGSIVHKL